MSLITHTHKGQPFQIMTGIPPGVGGTGELMKHLADGADDIKIISRPKNPQFSTNRLRAFVQRWAYRVQRMKDTRQWLEVVGAALDDATPLLIMHPQTIGYQRLMTVMNRRQGESWMYLLDASFFCMRSYNHVDDQFGPCLQCLGEVDRVSVRKLGCAPFPVPNDGALRFPGQMQKWVKSGRLKLLAQNKAQAHLAEMNFGVKVPVMGLWTQDMFSTFHEKLPQNPTRVADIVIHSHYNPAKGSLWALEVARHAPGLSFLFPFHKPACLDTVPENCTFDHMTWDTGLKEAVAASRFALTPSMWSAPIEGALIKNIKIAPAAGVMAHETGFGGELPENVALHLEANPKTAAAQLESNWQPDAQAKDDWLKAYEANGQNFKERLFDYIARHSSEKDQAA